MEMVKICISFRKKLKSLKGKIKKYNKEDIENIFEEKFDLEERFKHIQRQGMKEGYSLALREEEENVVSENVERERQEEVLWKQKSRVYWINEGE